MHRQALWRFARRVADVLPLTARGALALAIALFALFFYGYGSLDLVAFAVSLAGIILVALCSVAVVAAGLWLRRRPRDRPVARAPLEVGRPSATGFWIPSLAPVPLVQVGWGWLEPSGFECRIAPGRRRATELVVPNRRGEAPEIRRRVHVRDAFGLTSFAWEEIEPGPVLALPSPGRLRGVRPPLALASGDTWSHPSGAPDGDRMEIRRYVPGDSIRHILWKTWARTGQLNVRLPERSIERAQRTAAYLVAAPGDEPAAAAARVALEEGALGEDWVFGADGTQASTGSLEAALRAIARSADAPGRGAAHASGLASFLKELGGGVHCVIFASSRSGPWLEPMLNAAGRSGGTVSIVLGADGILPDTPAVPRWQRLLYTREEASGTSAGELSEVLQRISSIGLRSIVIDRASGRSFDASDRSLLRRSA
jgi:hypothetical protein